LSPEREGGSFRQIKVVGKIARTRRAVRWKLLRKKSQGKLLTRQETTNVYGKTGVVVLLMIRREKQQRGRKEVISHKNKRGSEKEGQKRNVPMGKRRAKHLRPPPEKKRKARWNKS